MCLKIRTTYFMTYIIDNTITQEFTSVIDKYMYIYFAFTNVMISQNIKILLYWSLHVVYQSVNTCDYMGDHSTDFMVSRGN